MLLALNPFRCRRHPNSWQLMQAPEIGCLTPFHPTTRTTLHATMLFPTELTAIGSATDVEHRHTQLMALARASTSNQFTKGVTATTMNLRKGSASHTLGRLLQNLGAQKSTRNTSPLVMHTWARTRTSSPTRCRDSTQSITSTPSRTPSLSPRTSRQETTYLDGAGTASRPRRSGPRAPTSRSSDCFPLDPTTDLIFH